MRWAVTCLLTLVSSAVTAQDFFTLKGHGGPIMDIAVAPSGQIATASFDNAVGVWEGVSPSWLDGHEAAVNSVEFWQDDTILSAGDDFAVRVWSVLNDDTARVLGKHQGKVMSLAVSQSTHIVASASWDGSIGLWSLGSEDRGSAFLKGHTQGVNDVVFNGDGSRLYSASIDGTIRVWDVSTGVELFQLVKHGFGVNELILNEEEGWLAYGAVDGGTRLVDIETGAEIADFTLDRRPVLALAFHAETQQLAVGDGEGYIMVVDVAKQRITRDFKAAQRGPVWALEFSRDGLNLHAGGIEDIMYSWPVETMTEHGQMATGQRSFLENPETLTNGERQFKRKCSICHAVTPGSARKAGPSLHNVFGRPAGTVADYSYSTTLNGSKIIWTDETIDQLFDLGPDHFIPGSKMPMQRITGAQDRRDLIVYLRQATQPPAANKERSE